MAERPASQEGEMLRRCAEGDPDAWRQLVVSYHRLAGAIVRRIFQRRGLAADAGTVEEETAGFFADVCIKGSRVLGSFRGEGSVRAWFAVVVANHARRRCEMILRERERLEQYAAAARADPRAGVSVDAEPAPWQEAVTRALARCSPHQRLLFQLLYVDGLSEGKAAGVLGLAPEALYLRKHRFLRKMRSLLGERSRGGEGSP